MSHDPLTVVLKQHILRRFLHPGEYLIIGTVGQNHTAQRLDIQLSEEESSAQREPGVEDISGIGLRKLPVGKETDFIDQTGKQDVPTERLVGRGSQRHRFWNIYGSLQ